MSSIAIASNDSICQSAKKWFVKSKTAIDSSDIENLGDGDTLYIIAHDAELKSGKGIIEFIENNYEDYPMDNWGVFLIVCSAASYKFAEDFMSPAERIANHFRRDVLASTTVVYGKWSDEYGAKFRGNYKRIKPKKIYS